MHGRKLRVAVVGLGKMGLVHTSVLNVLPDVELVALCEKSSLVRRFFKKVFKEVPISDDVEKLSRFGLDAVYVATPIPHHHSVARTVYLNKIAKNLFVEKTLAASYSEAEELCDLAERFGGVSMVGYLRRFYVTFAKAKSLLEEGKIGDLSSFKVYAFSSDFWDSKPPSEDSAGRGGVLSDLGCYAMDLALWFFGDLDVESARTEVFSQRSNSQVVRFDLCQNKGFAGVCDVSWCMKDYRMAEVGFSIVGSKGTIEVNDDKVELSLRSGDSARWYRHDLNDHVSFWVGAPEYFREDEYFIHRILDDGKAEPCFESASKVDKMIDEVKNKLGGGS